MEEHMAVAYRLMESNRKEAQSHQKIENAKRDIAREVKVSEYDPTYAMEQRH
jgi:hypothetical protein